MCIYTITLTKHISKTCTANKVVYEICVYAQEVYEAT